MPYDSIAINKLMGTPPVDDLAFEAWMANPDYELIVSTLYYPGRHGRHLAHTRALGEVLGDRSLIVVRFSGQVDDASGSYEQSTKREGRGCVRVTP